MPSEVTNYKCPSCNGPLRYLPGTDHLICDYCGSEFSIRQIESFYAEKDAAAVEAQHKAEEKKEQSKKVDGWDFSSIEQDWNSEGADLKQYNCPSCGAELICDATTAATSCPYCGNPTIVPGQLTGSLRPDYVIPFRYEKKAAVDALKKYYKGKYFLPKAFHDENHIEEIKGIYAPFWLYDGQVSADIVYHTTRSHTYRSGDEEVTTTDHYRVHRGGTISFEHVPGDASSKLPDPHMDSIEPYDYSELKPFSTGYLPGYMADKYDIEALDQIDRITKREKTTARNEIDKTVMGFSTVQVESENYRIIPGKVHYALMPVWLLTTNWKGNRYVFAMNGQTGKLIGDLPVDKGRFWLSTLLGGIGVAAVGFLLSLFL